MCRVTSTLTKFLKISVNEGMKGNEGNEGNEVMKGNEWVATYSNVIFNG